MAGLSSHGGKKTGLHIFVERGIDPMIPDFRVQHDVSSLYIIMWDSFFLVSTRWSRHACAVQSEHPSSCPVCLYVSTGPDNPKHHDMCRLQAGRRGHVSGKGNAHFSFKSLVIGLFVFRNFIKGCCAWFLYFGYLINLTIDYIIYYSSDLAMCNNMFPSSFRNCFVSADCYWKDREFIPKHG